MADVFSQITGAGHRKGHWTDVLKDLHGEGKHDGEYSNGLGREDSDVDGEKKKRDLLAKKAWLRWRRVAGHEVDLEGQMREGVGEFYQGWRQGISPKVEGRMKLVGGQSNGGGADGKEDETKKTSTVAKVKDAVKHAVDRGMEKLHLRSDHTS